MAGNTRWSPAERALLQEHYGSIPLRTLLQGFPGRSDRALRDQAHRMKLKKDPEATRVTISRGQVEAHARRREGAADG